MRSIVYHQHEVVNSYKDIDPDSVEGQTVRQMTDTMAELERLFTEGVADASENYRAVGENKKAPPDAKTETNSAEKQADDGEIKYSERYLEESPNSDILNLTRKVKTNNFKANEKVYFDNVSDDTAVKIKEILGVNVKGFKVAIEARQIEHILKDHGENGKTDHSMANDSDIAKMEYAMKNADSIVEAGRTQAYSEMVDGYNRTAKTVRYEANIGEKSYYLVQAVVDTNAKTLYVVSAYIGVPSTKKGASQLIDEITPDVTSQNGSVVTPNKSISQDSDSVNTKFSDRDQSIENVKKAEKHFGTTYNINEAGYLLTDGKFLDFSGKHDGAPGGYRTVDHRDIREALGLDYGGDDYSGGMIQFMQEGNIRLAPESGGINLSVKPNSSQLEALDRYISKFRGEIILDIDDAKGNTIASVE